MKKILSILLIIFMLSASLITIPVNAKIRLDESDDWAWSYSDVWTEPEIGGTASYATLDDYLNVHYVNYVNLDKSQITTLYILFGSRYTIQDLSGLYDFVNLKQLCIMYPNATTQTALNELDFSRLTDLEKLHLENVDISNLEIGELINLTYLDINWEAPSSAVESDYYKDLDLSKMEKLNHFSYYVWFPSDMTGGGLNLMDGIHRAVTAPDGCELNYNMDEEGYSWYRMYLKDQMILDLTTNKPSYAINENVVCTVSWNRNVQSAEYILNYDSSKLSLVDASIGEDFYYIAGDGEISVNWASLNETDLTEMSFTFNAINEGDAVFNVYPYEFATGDLDNVFDYSTTASAYNYTITIDSDYIKDDAPIQVNRINVDGEYFDIISGVTLTNNKLNLDYSNWFDDGVEVAGDGQSIGTGYILNLFVGEENVRTLWVLVYGDVNCDGEITAEDALTLIKAKNNKLPYSLPWYALEAGKVITGHQDVHDPSAIDALAIIKHLNGKYTISQSY